MRTVKLLTFFVAFATTVASAQFNFDPSIEIDGNWNTTTVVLPPSPLKFQVIFVGGVDMVQTTETYGNAATAVPAKEWHDFIGFTPDTESDDLGWLVVNHERIEANDHIGDGGGMTAFKVTRDANTDTIVVLTQTLSDGRTGKFFNVDFVNTVGPTGMNCGGINGPDGRIWTAEEWFRGDNGDIDDRDLGQFTIGSGTAANPVTSNDFPGYAGEVIEKYENYNWMVEVDAKEAVAVRKQYNWGRQPFEGGAFSDNSTAYLGADATPGFFTKFEATNPDNFTDGKTYVYKHDDPNKWVEIDNSDFDKMLNFSDEAVAAGATMYNRLEWVTYDEVTNAIYMTETGRDNPGSRWAGENEDGAVHAPHHLARSVDQAMELGVPVHPDSSEYYDYYGRILKYDLATQEVTVHLEGGPYFPQDSVSSAEYPDVHLSNPDGLSTMYIQGTPFLLIQEDLNGTSHGRIPRDITSNRTCEMYLLDLTITDPDYDDLVRISIVPQGAEITGAVGTPDGKTIFVNSQHPSSANPFPYNHSLTYAITGWDALLTSVNPVFDEADDFAIFPNPASRMIQFQEPMDVAIYDAQGQRVLVSRNKSFVDVSHLPAGIYFVQDLFGSTKKLVIEQ